MQTLALFWSHILYCARSECDKKGFGVPTLAAGSSHPAKHTAPLQQFCHRIKTRNNKECSADRRGVCKELSLETHDVWNLHPNDKVPLESKCNDNLQHVALGWSADWLFLQMLDKRMKSREYLESSLERKSRFPVYPRLEVFFSSGSCDHLGLVGHAGSRLTCSRICQLPDFWLSGMCVPCEKHVQSCWEQKQCRLSDTHSSNSTSQQSTYSRAVLPLDWLPLLLWGWHLREESCLVPYPGSMRRDHSPATPIDNSE